jgi:hypothetical protein
VGRSFDQLGKGVAQPKTYNAPKPDLTVEPKPRVNLSAGQPQQHVNQPAAQPRGNAPAGPPQGGQNQDKAKDKVKDK